jgi:transposase
VPKGGRWSAIKREAVHAKIYPNWRRHCQELLSLESEDCSATKRRLSRSGIVKFLAEVEPCAIGMEACGSAHYWARRFRAMGNEVKLTPPIYVKPYAKRGKNDAADAAAICEAMSRPNMRFVAVKSEDPQATLMAPNLSQLGMAASASLRGLKDRVSWSPPSFAC